MRPDPTDTADALPRYDALMGPVLRALAALGGSAANDEIADRVASDLGLTPALFDIVYPRNGKSVLLDRLSWARSYLRMTGLLHSGGRGLWLLTDAGRAALDTADAELRSFVRQRIAKAKATAPATALPEAPVADAEPADAEPPLEAWSDRLLAAMRAMPPAGFERLCQRLLRESGFTSVTVTGKSGDGGIDGHGVLRMNLISFHVLFQCKRYSGSVSSETVRNFRGAMQGRADKGLIITTGNFTAEARREATRDGAPAIDLIDGETLCQLLKDKQLGVAVRVVEEVTVDAGFFASI